MAEWPSPPKDCRSPELWGELGVGIRHQATNSMELVARYDLRLRKGLRDQTASARLNWAF